MADWKIPEPWIGETVFIVGGGTSVSYQRPDRLEGRKVIAINSSYETVPFAQYLFFGDNRWHLEHNSRPAFKAFVARADGVVTVSGPACAPYLKKLDRITPDKPALGLTKTRRGLSSQRTSFHGAINLAAMLGAKTIVLLGLDGTRGANGLTHHHTPHIWNNKPGDITWDMQVEQLKHVAPPLAEMGVEVFNTNPASRFKIFPFADLERFL